MTEPHPIALVTGGSRGLGRATVLTLAVRGVDSIFTYNANKAAADEVVAEVEKAGARAAAFQLDTGASAAFPDFVDRVRAVLKDRGAERIDFLVNYAGNSHSALFGQITEEDLDELYRIHFKGVLLLSQQLLPLSPTAAVS